MPETGTFLSVDPVESEPPYLYVRGNPVNLVDPSGRNPCPTGTCGPDITEWLMEEMRRHSEYGKSVKSLRDEMWWQVFSFRATVPYLDEMRTETPFTEIIKGFDLGNRGGTAAVDAVGLLEYALYGLAVDYSNVDYSNVDYYNDDKYPRLGNKNCGDNPCILREPRPGGIGYDQHPSVTICGRCQDASNIGNMMFGVGGNARGYSSIKTLLYASGYNFLNDVIQPALRLQFNQISNPINEDPIGALVGWNLASYQAIYDRDLFCGFLNVRDDYLDNAAEAAHCAACETDRFSPYLGHSIPTEFNRSLFAVSDDRSMISELKGRLGLP